MESKFQLVPLEEVVTIHDAKRKPITKADRKSGPYPYYGASDIADYVDGYIFDGVYLLLSEDGDNLRTRNTPIAFIASGKFWVNNHAHVLQGQDELDTLFLCYALQHAEIDSYISGSTRPKITQADLKKIPVFAPELKYRRQVARFVKDFDEKITLNRQINQTLEQMAQALFKSWFVDFDPVVDNALDAGFFAQDLDLPDELLRRVEARQTVRQRPDFKPLPDATRQLFPTAFEECSEPSLGLGGWVPQGWAVKTCDEISEKIGMGPFGSNIKISTFVKDGIPVISGTHLKQVLLEDHDYNFITEEHALKLKNSCVYRGDIIFTHAGNIGQVSLIPAESAYEKYMISQRQFYMRPDNNKINSSYLVYYFHSHDGQYKLLSNASQTGVPSIARPSTHLKGISLITPDMTVQDIFDHCITGWNKKIMKSREHIISLTNLRDTLLPKLISGELRLDNIETELATEQVN
jgi:type I restriction enzyme, S subunit